MQDQSTKWKPLRSLVTQPTADARPCPEDPELGEWLYEKIKTISPPTPAGELKKTQQPGAQRCAPQCQLPLDDVSFGKSKWSRSIQFLRRLLVARPCPEDPELGEWLYEQIETISPPWVNN